MVKPIDGNPQNWPFGWWIENGLVLCDFYYDMLSEVFYLFVYTFLIVLEALAQE